MSKAGGLGSADDPYVNHINGIKGRLTNWTSTLAQAADSQEVERKFDTISKLQEVLNSLKAYAVENTENEELIEQLGAGLSFLNHFDNTDPPVEATIGYKQALSTLQDDLENSFGIMKSLQTDVEDLNKRHNALEKGTEKSFDERDNLKGQNFHLREHLKEVREQSQKLAFERDQLVEAKLAVENALVNVKVKLADSMHTTTS
eukprot:Filipodium_phascolosomae@DN8013_c0_g1_i1.p1